ncbi:MAG: transketolase [Spirochaetaceae bacterium 4572_59]|nr:MAG: transketolase [Spirochaetaceae bacterium 4572_59]
MVTAREMDLLEQSYTGRGEAFFHVSGAGHEGSCILNSLLEEQDWLHCHYRDKALMMARGIDPEMFFNSLFNKEGSHSKGRQMVAHMSDPDRNILSMTGPVGNSNLHAAGIAEVVKGTAGSPIVLSSFGDGMSQQGDVLEAIAHAVRKELPVLFFVQDNGFAISTKTKGKTFFSRPDGEADSFYGIPITRLDGRYPQNLYRPMKEVVDGIRESGKPAIIVFSVERLHSHTNADDHRVYRTEEEIKALHESGDPVDQMHSWLLDQGISEEELAAEREEIIARLKEKAHKAQLSPEPEPIFTAKKEIPSHLGDRKQEYRGTPGKEELTMIEAIRETLRFHLDRNPAVELFGEDLEDPKGDVFGLTKTLSTQFPGRVENSPLAEASIVGLSIGRALAGKHSVAFLQFADFLPIAFNQLWAEAGSMYWRTDGGWECPMIVMVSCGAYKPGIGPFHASSMEALAAHIPGVDVVMPSTAGDAAGLLNMAFESGRPTIYFYPKVCLNEAQGKTSADVSRQLVPLGVARKVSEGEHLSFISYGNTIKLCQKAADVLKEQGVNCDIIDLRSISPWDQELVLESAEKTGRVIIVHEENKTVSISSEVAAFLAEKSDRKLAIKRLTREDTFVPCNFDCQLAVLPSYQRVLEAAVEMLQGSILWKKEDLVQSGSVIVEIIGTSPADETASVIEWKVEVGDLIEEGDLLAEIEADKAVAEMKSPVSGIVEELILEEGEAVEIGAPALKVKTSENIKISLKPRTKENPGEPVITGLNIAPAAELSNALPVADRRPYLVDVAGARGSREVDNAEIMKFCPGWEEGEILKMTGIEKRNWIGEGEDIISLAKTAALKVLSRNNLTLKDLSLILVSSGTPGQMTPSLATRIQYSLMPDGKREPGCPAFDINAACSGYIYGLQSSWDFLNSQSRGLVLLITAEVLSPLVDKADKSTSPIFGDGATASLIAGIDHPLKKSGRVRVFRPVTAACGEPGDILMVPADPAQHIYMHGPKVYLEAVASMITQLNNACVQENKDITDVSLIVPHQANQRIINAVRQRLKISEDQIYSEIRYNGNTSSCTIPFCLESLIKKEPSGHTLGLTAFGGGFTSAGGLLEIL